MISECSHNFKAESSRLLLNCRILAVCIQFSFIQALKKTQTCPQYILPSFIVCFSYIKFTYIKRKKYISETYFHVFALYFHLSQRHKYLMCYGKTTNMNLHQTQSSVTETSCQLHQPRMIILFVPNRLKFWIYTKREQTVSRH